MLLHGMNHTTVDRQIPIELQGLMQMHGPRQPRGHEQP